MVNVISKPNLFSAARATGNAQVIRKVAHWYEVATRNDFESLIELQRAFPSADWVADRVVFNLGSFRLICGVFFLRRAFFFKALLSHADYDKGGWKS
jgi:mRNA interferase HigB